MKRKRSDLRKETKKLDEEAKDLSNKIEKTEDRIDDLDILKSEVESIEKHVTELRKAKNNVEERAVEVFNEHMDQLLELLDYENLKRIWLESRKKEVRKGRRKEEKTFFDMHVVRRGEDGSVFTDSVETLSESERAVVGLVFGLAGYLAHDVGKSMPFLLMDSLEDLDGERIDGLIRHFEDETELVVAALLPEKAEELEPEDYNVVTTE
ncbi:MAG: hypothetical protein ABEK59_05685 [Halobacteria archaeon]